MFKKHLPLVITILTSFSAGAWYAGASESKPIRSFDGLTLIVEDLEAQKKFYQNSLGLTLVSDYGDAVFFRIGDNKLGLFARGHHPEGDTSLDGANKGISHLEFGIESKDESRIRQRLEQAGAHAYRDVYKDADGNLFHFNVDGTVNY